MNTDRKETDAFNKHFSKVNTVPQEPRMRRLRKALERTPTASIRTFEAEFTVTELDIALGKGKPGKAPGPDGITQEMLSHLGPKVKCILLNLFNRTWKSGELPRAWRTAVLVPNLKKGKCATAAESYRPISLTSVISKSMERMVNAGLYHYLEQNTCLDESQSGFRRHRTTVDQLVRFTQSVINAWQAKSHTVAVFVVLEKAYDRVWRTGLEVRLQEHGITGRMYRWLKAFLTESFIRTRIKGTLSSTRPLADGLPQGSALSCTLNPVLKKVLDIRIEKDSLHRDDLPRYLGVSLDPRLCLRRHIEEVANSVRERIRILQKLDGTNWGVTPKSLRTIYVSFTRAVLEYANPVLNLASRTSLEKLDRVQNAALRLVLGALRSTPIAILELATGFEPLGLRRGEQTVFAQERYLRTGEGAPLRTMVENFSTRHRRIKKVSVLSVAHDLSKTYGVPTDRAPLPVPPRAPETAPTPPPPPVTSLYIGPMGRKEETCPLAMRALSLETIARFGRENAIAYTDGSSNGGTGNGATGSTSCGQTEAQLGNADQ
ncbi:reverse transcriptase-like protein [Plakobranchus ocellatus]|uniref:Reverse transcriptase-like protein n=1 Tax=Plakobranchus ocellatus TaxID=259542 RepID=A0AAV4CW79_9GAST|nr:reverse transcriptase-like protein [Plakobranchus ocellatus]